jgi:hypothetical protein
MTSVGAATAGRRCRTVAAVRLAPGPGPGRGRPIGRQHPIWSDARSCEKVRHVGGRSVRRYDETYEHQHGRRRTVIDDVVAKCLECGVLESGFARVRCPDCRAEYLLGFSCKCRYFCPSCHAKRLATWSVWLEADLLAAVPHRQFVFSVPKRLRPYFLWRRRLLGDLAGSPRGREAAWGALARYCAQSRVAGPAVVRSGHRHGPLRLGQGGGAAVRQPAVRRTGLRRPPRGPHPRQGPGHAAPLRLLRQPHTGCPTPGAGGRGRHRRAGDRRRDPDRAHGRGAGGLHAARGAPAVGGGALPHATAPRGDPKN